MSRSCKQLLPDAPPRLGPKVCIANDAENRAMETLGINNMSSSFASTILFFGLRSASSVNREHAELISFSSPADLNPWHSLLNQGAPGCVRGSIPRQSHLSRFWYFYHPDTNTYSTDPPKPASRNEIIARIDNISTPLRINKKILTLRHIHHLYLFPPIDSRQDASRCEEL